MPAPIRSPPSGDLRTAPREDAGDVDEQLRLLDAEPHQVDEVRAAGEELRLRRGGDRRHRVAFVGGPPIVERLQDATTSSAATMFA